MVKVSVIMHNNVNLEKVKGAIDERIRLVLSKRTKLMKDDIVNAWPVKTGRSKAGWRIRANQYSSAVVNKVRNPITGVAYVDDLWRGLPWGSDQLPLGGDPIFAKHAALFINDLKKGGLK